MICITVAIDPNLSVFNTVGIGERRKNKLESVAIVEILLWRC